MSTSKSYIDSTTIASASLFSWMLHSLCSLYVIFKAHLAVRYADIKRDGGVNNGRGRVIMHEPAEGKCIITRSETVIDPPSRFISRNILPGVL